MKKVKLTGPGNITVDGRRFRIGVEESVPDKLAKELLSGSDRLMGHTFEAVGGKTKDDDEPSSTSDETT